MYLPVPRFEPTYMLPTGPQWQMSHRNTGTLSLLYLYTLHVLRQVNSIYFIRITVTSTLTSAINRRIKLVYLQTEVT